MKSTMYNEALALLQKSQQIPHGIITEAQLVGLPEPAQRYLSYTLLKRQKRSQ